MGYLYRVVLLDKGWMRCGEEVALGPRLVIVLDLGLFRANE